MEFCSDNTAVVEVSRSCTSRDSNVMVLLRHLSMLAALLPTNEHTLLRFCSHLVDRMHHSSIKVYLSAVRSLHIYYGFPDPLVHCLQLQHLLRGIKHHQGSRQPQRQPVTEDLIHVIHRSVDLQNPNHIMLWAACCIGLFGLLSIPPLTHPFI